MKILVTGGLGWTAKAVVEELLNDGHDLTVFDLPDVPIRSFSGPVSVVRGDISNFEDVKEITKNIDIVIHLAVAIGSGDYDDPNKPFSVNVRGMYNLLESARKSGVMQLIVLGSAPVHIAHNFENKFTINKRASSSGEDHLYDLTKRLQEEIAQDFSETYHIPTLVLRVGHIVDSRKQVDPENRPLSDLEYCKGFWICRYDVAAACLHGIKNTMPGFNCYHVIGDMEAHKHFDIAKTENEFGFTPIEKFNKFGV